MSRIRYSLTYEEVEKEVNKFAKKAEEAEFGIINYNGMPAMSKEDYDRSKRIYNTLMAIAESFKSTAQRAGEVWFEQEAKNNEMH